MMDTDPHSEFWQDVWWVPDEGGGFRNAKPSEVCAEIKRLRLLVDELRERKDEMA